MKSIVRSIVKMKSTDKKVWTSALRSGEFKQGDGCLIENDYGQTKHCCLGVAAEVLGDRKPREGEHMLRHGRFGLASSVQHALAAANDGQIGNEFKNLGVPQPRLNREGRATFGSIANWVDKYL